MKRQELIYSTSMKQTAQESETMKPVVMSFMTSDATLWPPGMTFGSGVIIQIIEHMSNKKTCQIKNEKGELWIEWTKQLN